MLAGISAIVRVEWHSQKLTSFVDREQEFQLVATKKPPDFRPNQTNTLSRAIASRPVSGSKDHSNPSVGSINRVCLVSIRKTKGLISLLISGATKQQTNTGHHRLPRIPLGPTPPLGFPPRKPPRWPSFCCWWSGGPGNRCSLLKPPRKFGRKLPFPLPPPRRRFASSGK